MLEEMFGAAVALVIKMQILAGLIFVFAVLCGIKTLREPEKWGYKNLWRYFIWKSLEVGGLTSLAVVVFVCGVMTIPNLVVLACTSYVAWICLKEAGAQLIVLQKDYYKHVWPNLDHSR